ncbi:MAG: hypothetical protein HY763_05825 [Planctomycetes bacterium]|nr:hypothetical protein [Planctomycetota bacterium]
MGEVHRRVILKPADLTPAGADQLSRALSAAIEAQRLLAGRSLHVLRLTGELRQDERSFYVEHEPARPALAAPEVFNTDLPGADEQTLLRLTAAVFDALRVIHSGEAAPLRAHGGLCPGVILTTPEGIEKVTDFGFAAAVCTALGAEAYKNLAVGPPTDGAGIPQATGVWEVLSPDEYARDDRICAFIDPHKCVTEIMTAFEWGSDVIAAGFLLHLAAEHSHPYLNDPGAYREVETCMMMGALRYTGARRTDLRKSPEPAVQTWCRLLERMLANLPQQRPPAAEVLKELAGHGVKPVDPTEILARQLEALEHELRRGAGDQVDWAEKRAAVQALAETRGLSPAVAQRGQALLAFVDAHLRLARAAELLEGDNWAQAGELLDSVRSLPDPTPFLTKTSATLSARLNGLQEVESALQTARQASEAIDDTAGGAEAELQALARRLEALPPDIHPAQARARESLSAGLAQRTARVAAERQERERQAQEKARRETEERQADAKAAHDWLSALEAALKADGWEKAFPKLHGQRPALRYPPPDLDSRAAALDQQFNDRLAKEEQERRIAAAHRRAEEWIEKVRRAVDAEKWDKAEELLGARPPLPWPAVVSDTEKLLADKVRQARDQQTQQQAAREWLGQAKKLHDAGKLPDAYRVLTQKPTVAHWPDDVLQEAARLESVIKGKLETAELERQKLEQARRTATAWFDAAAGLAESGKWTQAIAALEKRPDLKHAPEGLSARADELLKRCRQEHENSLQRRREAHTGLLREHLRATIHNTVAQELHGCLSVELLAVTVDGVQFKDAETFAQGAARLSLSVQAEGRALPESGFSLPIEFRIRGDAVELANADAVLAEPLVAHLRALLTRLQKEQLASLAGPLRKGLFPNAGVESRLAGVEPRISVAFHLMGAGVADATLAAPMVWNPSALNWDFADAGEFTRHALDIVTKSARKTVGPAFFEHSPALQRYRDRIHLEVDVPPLSGPRALGKSLPLEIRVELRTNRSPEPEYLHTVTATCTQVGKVAVNGDLKPAEAGLRKLIVAAQVESRDKLQNELQGRVRGARAKVVGNPARITEPVDAVSFGVSMRKREPEVLKAAWNASELRYQQAEDWEAILARLMVAPPAPAVAEAGGPKAPGRRGLMLAGVALAVLGVVGVGWAFLKSGRPPRPSPPPVVAGDPGQTAQRVICCFGSATAPSCKASTAEQCAKESGGVAAPGEVCPDAQGCDLPDGSCAEVAAVCCERWKGRPRGDGVPCEHAVPPEPPSQPGKPLDPGPAVAQLRGILSASQHLRPHATQLVPDVPAVEGTQVALKYRLPGLANPQRTVAATAPDGGAAAISESGAAEIAAEVKKLDSLLSLATAKPQLQQALSAAAARSPAANFFNAPSLEWRVDGPAQWTLSANETWRADGVHAVGVTTGAGAGETALVDLSLPLAVSSGNAAWEPDARTLDAEIAKSIRAKLLERQNQQLGTVSAASLELPEGCTATAAVQRITEPAEAFLVTAKCAGLVDRTLTMAWDVASLAFVLDDASRAQRDAAALAHAVLAELNARLPKQPADYWLRAVTQGPLLELAAPADGTWTLVVAAPWASRPAPAGAGAVEQRLVLPVKGALAGAQPAAVAEQLLKERAGIEKPGYWPIVVAYLETAQPGQRSGRPLGEFCAGASEALASRAGASLPEGLVPVVHFTGTDKPQVQYTGQTPASLTTRCEARWELDPAFAARLGKSAVDLTTRLQGQTTTGPATFARTSSGAFGWTCTPELLDAIAGKLPALQKLLDEVGPGNQVERLAAGLLAGQETVDLRANLGPAFDLLKAVGALKGEGTPTAKSLVDVATALRRKKLKGTVSPTIAVEYFCATEHCYGMIWSMSALTRPNQPAELLEGPALRRLCKVEELPGLQGRAGETLVDPLLQLVPQALLPACDAPEAVKPLADKYDKTLGVVVGVDEKFQEAGVADFAAVGVTPLRSCLRPTPASGARIEPRDWTALADLNDERNRSYLCGAWIVPALVKP